MAKRLAPSLLALAVAALEATSAVALSLSPASASLAPWWLPLLAASVALVLVGGYARQRRWALPVLLLLPATLGVTAAAAGQGALAGLALTYGSALVVGEACATLALAAGAREGTTTGLSLALGALAASAVALVAEGLGMEVTSLGLGVGAAAAAGRLASARFADALDAEGRTTLDGALARTCAAPHRLLLAAVGRNEG